MKRVLIVEDERIAARVASDACDKAGFVWTVVHKRADGIRQLEREVIDCILLDLGLPDSPEPMETLKTMLAAVAAPVVVLTATDDEEVERECIAAGAQEYMVKHTIDVANIGRVIRRAIARYAAKR